MSQAAPAKTLAITGIGGFIGGRLTERALALGWQVRGLEQSEDAATRIRALGAWVRVGDINNGHALAKTFSGADVVVHTAAVVEEDGPRELFERVNIEGTRSVCVAASAARVKRLVQVSSVMVYGFDYPPDVTEEGPFSGGANIYNETKLASERVALSFNTVRKDARDGFGVIVVRPGDVYGAGGTQWVLRPLDMLRRYRFAVPYPLTGGGEGLINHVHIDNLIDAIFLALKCDACGEAFNITDDRATPCREFFRHHQRMLGRWWLPVAPAPVIRASLRFQQWIYRALRRKPPALPSVVAFLSRRHRVSCEKAKKELGYVPRVGLEDGMRRVAEELVAQGHRVRLPAPSA